MSINSAGQIIDQVKKNFPEKPGVYLFFDNIVNVIYIGKSVNLRRRVSGYFHKSNIERRVKTKILVASISKVKYIETLNDFLALLIEDKLIKKYFPYYNVRQKKYKKYRYLLLTSGLYPTLRIINNTRKVRNKIIFGPFNGKYYIDSLINIIQKYFKLRLCSDTNPVTKCLYHDLEYCNAPCIMNIMPLEYTAIVNKVIEFLSGNIESLIPMLEKILNNHIASAEFENAEETKGLIEFCKGFADKQKFFYRFKYGKLKIFENNDSVPSYIFNKGRLHVNCKTANNQIIESNNGLFYFDNELFKDSRILLDRANIVYNWITNNKNRCRHIFEN